MLLKFKDASRKFFYWLQEPKDDKDEDYLKKVYIYIGIFIQNGMASSIVDTS